MLSLMHDLDTMLPDSPMSFEFAGTIDASEALRMVGADATVADSVVEAAIRHQGVYDAPETTRRARPSML